MTVEQLNEFKFLQRFKAKKVAWKMKDGYAHFQLDGFDKIYILKYGKSVGYPDIFGLYRMYIKAKEHIITNDHTSVTFAVKDLIGEINKLIKKSKSGKTETSPADLPQLNIKMFDIRKLDKDIK